MRDGEAERPEVVEGGAAGGDFLSMPALPSPSPAAVGLVLAISVVWMAGVVVWTRRGAEESKVEDS